MKDTLITDQGRIKPEKLMSISDGEGIRLVLKSKVPKRTLHLCKSEKERIWVFSFKATHKLLSVCSCLELMNMATEGLRFCKSWFFMSRVLLFALAAGNETRISQNKVISLGFLFDNFSRQM